MSSAGGTRVSMMPSFGRKKARVATAPGGGCAPKISHDSAPLTTMKSIMQQAKAAAFNKRAMDDDLDSLDGDSPTTLKEKRKERQSVKFDTGAHDGVSGPMAMFRPSFFRGDSMTMAMNKINVALLQRDMSMLPQQAQFGVQITRDATKVLKAVQNTNFAEMLRMAIISTWMIGSLCAFTFMCKVVFGPPGRTEVPDTYSSIALAQMLCSGVYVPCILFAHKGELAWVLRALVSPKYLLICFPYAIGYALNYWLWCEGFKVISTATGIAIVQGRLFLDMLIAYIMMSTPVPAPKFLLVGACFVVVVTHTMTVPAGPMSTDPALGRLLFGLFVVESALQYSWFPWAIPKYSLSPVLLSYLSSVMTAGVSVFLYWVGSEKGLSGIADGYIVSDMAVFVAWMSVDAAVFFCPIWVSPLFMTLCCAITMPILLFLEMLVFGEPFRLPQFLSVMAVAISVMAVGMYSAELDSRAHPFDDGDDAKPLNSQKSCVQASRSVGMGGGLGAMQSIIV